MHKLRSMTEFNYFEGSVDRGQGGESDVVEGGVRISSSSRVFPQTRAVREKAKQIMDLLASNQTIRDEREKARKLRDKVRLALAPPPSHCLETEKLTPSPRVRSRLRQFAGLKSASSEGQWGGISSGGRYGECERRAAHATRTFVTTRSRARRRFWVRQRLQWRRRWWWRWRRVALLRRWRWRRVALLGRPEPRRQHTWRRWGQRAWRRRWRVQGQR